MNPDRIYTIAAVEQSLLALPLVSALVNGFGVDEVKQGVVAAIADDPGHAMDLLVDSLVGAAFVAAAATGRLAAELGREPEGLLREYRTLSEAELVLMREAARVGQ